MHISLKVMQLVTTDWTFELCLGSLSFCTKSFRCETQGLTFDAVMISHTDYFAVS